MCTQRQLDILLQPKSTSGVGLVGTVSQFTPANIRLPGIRGFPKLEELADHCQLKND